MKTTPQEVYESLRSYQRTNGYPPTLRELANRLQVHHTTVLNVLHYLKNQGFIRHRKYAPRAYWIPSEPHPRRP